MQNGEPPAAQNSAVFLFHAPFSLPCPHYLIVWDRVIQGPKLRLPGRQCDQKFSPGDQNFIAGRQLATCKAGCYCRLSRSEKMIKN